MADPLVLKEKLRPPNASGLARERLEKPLLTGPPIGLHVVVAPAGSGKTTLLSRVAAAATVPVGWYRLTADDSTENRLVAHLERALAPVAKVQGATTMAQLLAELDEWNGPNGLLILDDLHEIADTHAEGALERFVSLRPPPLQLIFGSRRTPEVNIPRMRVSASIHEIGGDDLRFRSWEVEELFASVFGEPLRPEAAAALTRRTGGWAAGLQLFHLSTAGRSSAERHHAVDELAGRSKLVRSYLTRNVLADLPEDRRQFLLRTCTLGRLSGATCDALLGTSGSHRILEELENAQLFTFTDDGGTYFRYHEILQTHLEMALVEQYGVKEARSWYAQSGAILTSIGERRAAARAYAKSGDWAAVSRLVREPGGTRIDAADLDHDHVFPASTWQHDPWLAVANARRLVREGALGPAADAYQHARTLYDEPQYQQLCLAELRDVAVWLPGAHPQNHTRLVSNAQAHWSAALRDALRMSPDFNALPAAAVGEDARTLFGYAMAALTAGEIRRARDLLASIRPEESADSIELIGAGLATAAVDLISGRAAEPGATFSDIASLAENEGYPWLARLAHGFHHVALALVGSQDGCWRLQCSSDMIRANEQLGDIWGASLLTFAVALAKQQVGDVTAETEFACAAKLFKDLDAPVLELWCRLLALRTAADAEDIRRAVETSRALRMRGALALGLAMSAAASPASSVREMREATELAAACGIELADVLGERVKSRPPAKQHASQERASDVAPVQIYCFGRYRLQLDGRTVELSALRPQARNVLQLLSLAPGRDFHREFVEDILWPGVEHSVAGHRLQVAVSSVRTMFDPATLAIRRRGESYRLCVADGSTVDVVDFEQALSLAAACSARGDVEGRISARQKALSLYAGDLLPEFGSTEHVDAERQRLRRSAGAAAAALASDYRALGDYEQAMDVAQRSVQLDPEQEIPWLILAELHDRAGDPVSADYVRREHARIQANLEVSTS